MNREEFIKNITKTYKDGIELIKRKNADYAADQDPFLNFKNSEAVGVTSERGILVRVMDKISRISNLLDRPAAVVSESLEDSLLDCINYLAILKAKIDSNKK